MNQLWLWDDDDPEKDKPKDKKKDPHWPKVPAKLIPGRKPKHEKKPKHRKDGS